MFICTSDTKGLKDIVITISTVLKLILNLKTCVFTD